MLTFFSWQLYLGLLITSTYSLQGWNIDTQIISDMVPSEPLLENGVTDTPGLALASADGSSDFAQTPPKEGHIEHPDGILVQDGNGCPSDTRTHPRRVRARDEKMCPTNLLRPNGEGEQERKPLHVSPNAQGGGGGQNTGGNGYPTPSFIIPPEDSKLPYLFIPEENRPRGNPELCHEAKYPVPVCGRPSDTYLSSYSNLNQLMVDPCYPYAVLVGCISVEGGRIGYCCSSAEVAYGYDGLRDGEIDLWQEILAGEGEMLWEIQKALMSGLSNPFKLVGLDCVPMGAASREIEPPTPF